MHSTRTPILRTYARCPLASSIARPHVFRRQHATQHRVTRSLCGCGRPLAGRHRYPQSSNCSHLSEPTLPPDRGLQMSLLAVHTHSLFVDYLSTAHHAVDVISCMAPHKMQSACCRLPASHSSRPSWESQLRSVRCHAKPSSFDINEVGWDVIEIADMDVDSMKLHQLKSELKARRQTLVGMLCRPWGFTLCTSWLCAMRECAPQQVCLAVAVLHDGN